MSWVAIALLLFEALEHFGEDAVKAVEVTLVLHERGARQIVEIIDAVVRDVGFHGAEQGQYSVTETPMPALRNCSIRLLNMGGPRGWTGAG